MLGSDNALSSAAFFAEDFFVLAAFLAAGFFADVAFEVVSPLSSVAVASSCAGAALEAVFFAGAAFFVVRERVAVFFSGVAESSFVAALEPLFEVALGAVLLVPVVAASLAASVVALFALAFDAPAVERVDFFVGAEASLPATADSVVSGVDVDFRPARVALTEVPFFEDGILAERYFRRHALSNYNPPGPLCPARRA